MSVERIEIQIPACKCAGLPYARRIGEFRPDSSTVIQVAGANQKVGQGYLLFEGRWEVACGSETCPTPDVIGRGESLDDGIADWSAKQG